jgi:hypothetical protein
MTNLYDIRRTLTEGGILICFNGPFSHSIIEELGKAVKKHLESAEVQKSAMMDVFSVFIEATQNVRNYATRPDLTEAERPGLNTGIIVIAKDGPRYVVHSGNCVRHQHGEQLIRRLDALAALDKAGLKACYKEQLRRDLPAGSQGAGLGLIDMARKASEALHYSLVPESEGYAFFSLRVVI